MLSRESRWIPVRRAGFLPEAVRLLRDKPVLCRDILVFLPVSACDRVDTLVLRPEAADLPDIALVRPALMELWLALARLAERLDLTLLRLLPALLPTADFLLAADFTAEISKQGRDS